MIALFKVEDIQTEIASTAEYLIERCSKLLPHSEVHHIGSSSIPGALTKGDVDILVMVDDSKFGNARSVLDAEFSHNPEMQPESHFVSYSGKYMDRDFGVQLVKTDSESEFHFLKAKYALLENPALLAEYNAIKQSANGGSMESYRVAKSEFIEDLVDGM